MESSASAFPSKALTRRQFCIALSGGALLLVTGGTVAVVARSEHSAGTSAVTTFGTVSILRAGRFARLDAQGHTAVSNLMTAASHFSGRSTKSSLPAGTRSARGIGDSHGHGDYLQNEGWPQPVNHTWGDVLVLEAEIRNSSQDPVLFTPAQLQLKVVPSGTAVVPQDSDRAPGTLDVDTAEQVLISYLVPHQSADLELEFSEVLQGTPLRIALPPLTATGELL